MTTERKSIITKEEAVRLIIESDRAGIAFIETETELKMNKFSREVVEGETVKTANPFLGRITKKSRVKVLLNTAYKNAMTKVLKELGELEEGEEYEPKPRTWGERVGKTAVITHKGNSYLDTRVLESYKTEYYLDGVKPIEKKEFKAFLGKRKPSEFVIIRDYKIESIKTIAFNNLKLQLI